MGTAAVDIHADQLLDILGVDRQASETADSRAAPDTAPVQSWQVTLDLYESGHTVLAIAERRMLSPGTVASHLVLAMKQGQQIDLKRSLPPVETVQLVRRLLGEDPDATIADLQERLDHRLSNSDLRLVLAHLRPPV
ncbi:MAG: helix-turn-helix domain-containing protein [Chloroflexi bacterium]|nr:helix-turn-helix domain-containing protein [Chloroflexota bacterium]